jgi:hypothetical protein
MREKLGDAFDPLPHVLFAQESTPRFAAAYADSSSTAPVTVA